MTSSPNDPKTILPESWLSGPPDAPLPVEYSGAVYDKLEAAGDAYLAWKAQEYLTCTRRLAECDADLVADALMMAAEADGPRAVRKPLRKILRVLAWLPGLGDQEGLRTRLATAVDLLKAALKDSPSVAVLFDAKAIAAEWWRTHHQMSVWLGVEADGLRCQPEDYPCPWASLDQVLAAARERLRGAAIRHHLQEEAPFDIMMAFVQGRISEAEVMSLLGFENRLEVHMACANSAVLDFAADEQGLPVETWPRGRHWTRKYWVDGDPDLQLDREQAVATITKLVEDMNRAGQLNLSIALWIASAIKEDPDLLPDFPSEREVIAAFSASRIGVEGAAKLLGVEPEWRVMLDLLAKHDLPYPHPSAVHPGRRERIARVARKILRGNKGEGGDT